MRFSLNTRDFYGDELTYRGILKLLAGLLIILVIVGSYVIYRRFLGDHWSESRDFSLNMGLTSVYAIEDTVRIGYKEKFLHAKQQLDLELSQHLVVVDISEQKEYIFNKDGDILHIYRISTGRSDLFPVEVCDEVENDEGEEEEVCEQELESRQMGPSVWKVASKAKGEFAPTYGPRIMMLHKRVNGNWVRTQVALHGTDQPNLLGMPTSLGCIYHENVDIIELFEILEVGDYVVAIE